MMFYHIKFMYPTSYPEPQVKDCWIEVSVQERATQTRTQIRELEQAG